jgi:RimJ/RimL family protein N-acetyltransferase
MPDVIWGQRVGLRRLRPSDAKPLLKMVSRPEVARLLFEEVGNLPTPFWLGFLIWSQRLQGRPDFGIVDQTGTLIGCVRLWRISRINRNAMLTIFLGDRGRWGRGLGTEALRLCLRYGFDELSLERIELHVFSFNHRAIRSYEKVGFRTEGIRRGALYRDGEYHDILVMGIRRFEFHLAEAARTGKETTLDGENRQESVAFAADMASRPASEGGDSHDGSERSDCILQEPAGGAEPG